MEVPVDQLFARIGAKDVELMLKDQTIAGLRAELAAAKAAAVAADAEVTRLRAAGDTPSRDDGAPGVYGDSIRVA